jgi:elongation factor Ts
MVEGRIEKYYKQVCLMDQAYIRNPDISVQQLTNEIIAKIGENISVRRFTRYEMGEGLQKREENFADEVAKQMNK